MEGWNAVAVLPRQGSYFVSLIPSSLPLSFSKLLFCHQKFDLYGILNYFKFPDV